jgi:hypothetical protein
LFGKCSECNKSQCNECPGKPETHEKTTATDVYAFGCLYYAVSLSIDPSARVTRLVQIFFNSVPYYGELPFRIGWLVTRRELPPRLENPEMEGSTWDLIGKCWEWEPSNRPKMEEIVEMITSFIEPADTFQSLLAIATKVLYALLKYQCTNQYLLVYDTRRLNS